MGAKSGENLGPELPADNGNAYRVDLRGAVATVVGDNATQVNVFYNGTYSDGVAPPPLISGQGTIASPYRGLNAFEEQDAGLFFGREDATAEALELISERLQRSGLLVISGVSGAGKSSLLRAGMLPELRRAGLKAAPEAASWPCLVFTPTSDPLRELAVRVAPLVRVDAGELRDRIGTEPAGFALTARAAALAGPDGLVPGPAQYTGDQRRLLIVVDQCEQLFTRCGDEAVRE